MDGLAQEMYVLTSTKIVVMEQLVQLTAEMGKMQERIKNMNMGKNPKRKYDCWSCGSNLKHRIRSCPKKKSGHKDNVH